MTQPWTMFLFLIAFTQTCALSQ